MYESIALIFFPALMIFAAFSDILTMTISNRLSLALIFAFPIMAWALGMSYSDIGWHFLCGFVVLTIVFVLFSFGWIGGGDAKLAAAAGLWFGFDNVLMYLAYTSIFGGALTLGIISMRRWPLPKPLWHQEWALRLHDSNNGVPYGIALAIAAVWLYPETSVWMVAGMRS